MGNRTVALAHSSFNTKWLTQKNIDPKVIVELGAFDGGDALRMSGQFPDCMVVSVEADPVRYKIVKENLSGSRVILENLAVCETDGPVPWFSATMKDEVHAQGSLYRHTDNYKAMFPDVEQRDQTETVQGTRIDSLCVKHGITQIDLLHMDIEGAEIAALRGLGKFRPKMIFAEMCEDRFVDVPTVNETHELLCSLGYTLIADLGADRLYLLK